MQNPLRRSSFGADSASDAEGPSPPRWLKRLLSLGPTTKFGRLHRADSGWRLLPAIYGCSPAWLAQVTGVPGHLRERVGVGALEVGHGDPQGCHPGRRVLREGLDQCGGEIAGEDQVELDRLMVGDQPDGVVSGPSSW